MDQLNLNTVPFSLLDLCFVREGEEPRNALHDTREMAILADELGYSRYWLAEHHNVQGIASAATSVVIGYVAGLTQRIRVGAGGIMLPNHAPLVVAEQFGTLEALYPGRIDLGLGRAPGTDPLTIRALRRDRTSGAESFPDDVRELQSYFQVSTPDQRVRAVPGEGMDIPLWMLGSSGFSAQLASELGLPFAFASHFAPEHTLAAFHQYRRDFRPSKSISKPHTMVSVNVVVANTDAEAKQLFTSAQQGVLSLIRGSRVMLQAPIESMDGVWNQAEKQQVDRLLSYSCVGSPETVRNSLTNILLDTQADEVITTARIYDLKARLTSLQLLASLFRA